MSSHGSTDREQMLLAMVEVYGTGAGEEARRLALLMSCASVVVQAVQESCASRLHCNLEDPLSLYRSRYER